MFRFLRSPAAAALVLLAVAMAPADASAAGTFPGIGRAATDKEVRAWDIDVRPDFKGLPPGSGTVSKGQDIWETRCMSCHGVFGESNEVFNPIVGGTTKEDIQTGRVARLTDEGYPARTTMMKLPTLSTLWDYINRAMPWNAPKSLSTNEVYAVTAFLLNLGGVVPDDHVLSDANIADVQKRLPNRNGVTTAHGLWPGKGLGGAGAGSGKPDIRATACMKDCAPEAKLASILPDFARNNNGNLAEQQRLVGPQRGADTSRPPGAPPALAAAPVAAMPAAAPATPPAGATAAPGAPAGDPGAAALALAQKSGCTACHGVDNRLVGPGFREIAAKYTGRADAESYLAGKIRTGGQGIWGAIPMPAQSLSDADAGRIAQWLAAGAKK